MRTENNWKIAIGLVMLTLALTISLTAGSSAKEKPSRVNEAGNSVELKCRVSGSGNKVITMTNESDRVIAKGTRIRFDGSTGIQEVKSLRKNLKPRRTTIIHIGRFVGYDCRCQLVEQQ